MSWRNPEKPKHLTQHEWDEQLRRTQQQLEYDLYNMPKWQRQFATGMAVVIIASLVLAICIGIFQVVT